jgi:hypothetical protein
MHPFTKHFLSFSIGFFVAMMLFHFHGEKMIREKVFNTFFFNRSHCIDQEAYTNGEVTWVVNDKWNFTLIKGAPSPCNGKGEQ